MASHEPVQLSPPQWIKLVGLLAAAVCRSIYLTSSWCVQRTRPSWPVSRSFAVAFLRQAGHLSHKQIRATTPPTGQQIREYCRDYKVPLASVDIDTACPGIPHATLHFLNCQPSDDTPILLFCHGGGYVNPIIKNGHIPYALHAAKVASGVEGRVALLEYTLAPDLKYPGQVAQISAALRLLLSSRKPNQIIVAGDSAGGNLVLALLAHLKQPHPTIPPVNMSAGSKLRGVFLLSPWVSLETTAPSFRENTDTDYITFTGMGDFKDLWQPDANHVWAQPLLGGTEFWKHDVPVEKILLTAGAWEVLRDQILCMGEMMGAVREGKDPSAPVQFALNAEEVHVQCVFDQAINLHDSGMSKSVDDWLLLV